MNERSGRKRRPESKFFKRLFSFRIGVKRNFSKTKEVKNQRGLARISERTIEFPEQEKDDQRVSFFTVNDRLSFRSAERVGRC